MRENIYKIYLLFDTMKRFDKLEQIHHELWFNPWWPDQVLHPFMIIFLLIIDWADGRCFMAG